MGFSGRTTTFLQQAFERASEHQPAEFVRARIGELEINALVELTKAMAGEDDREAAVQMFVRHFREADGSFKDGEEKYFCVNGVHFLATFDQGYVRVCAEGGPTDTGAWTLFYGCDDEPERYLRLCYQLAEDNMVCRACKKTLALAKDYGVCEGCKDQWSSIPCSACGCGFGNIEADGKHANC